MNRETLAVKSLTVEVQQSNQAVFNFERTNCQSSFYQIKVRLNKQIKVLIKKHNRYDFSLVQFVANEHNITHHPLPLYLHSWIPSHCAGRYTR